MERGGHAARSRLNLRAQRAQHALELVAVLARNGACVEFARAHTVFEPRPELGFGEPREVHRRGPGGSGRLIVGAARRLGAVGLGGGIAALAMLATGLLGAVADPRWRSSHGALVEAGDWVGVGGQDGGKRETPCLSNANGRG